jgi:hypothetical protein
MPTLQNSRWEKFAQNVAKGMTLVDAHADAGYERNDGNAVTLSRRPEIAGRIKELKGAAAEAAVVTTAGLIAEAEEARLLAMEERNAAAAVAAIREKGVLSGKRIERAERGGPGEFDWLENLSADELREMITRAMNGEGFAAPSSETKQ